LDFRFFLVANANFRVHIIPVYLANAQATRINVKIEPSFTQRVRATLAFLKAPNDHGVMRGHSWLQNALITAVMLITAVLR